MAGTRGGFLDKILALFGGEKDGESGKKKQLRKMVRELSGNKYARFYRPKTEEIDGSLGKFFYDVYKIISPAQVFLQNAGKSAQLKQVCAEAFLDKNLEEVKRRIGAESIGERAKTWFCGFLFAPRTFYFPGNMIFYRNEETDICGAMLCCPFPSLRRLRQAAQGGDGSRRGGGCQGGKRRRRGHLRG
jgi:hypothetical protein